MVQKGIAKCRNYHSKLNLRVLIISHYLAVINTVRKYYD